MSIGQPSKLADNRKSYHPIEALKYGLEGGRGHRVHKTETQATTLMARRLGPSDGLVLEYIHFHHFQCRPRALISRERVPKSNTGKYKERGNSDPKNMSPCDRIKEFPGEKFVSSRWKTVLQWV